MEPISSIELSELGLNTVYKLRNYWFHERSQLSSHWILSVDFTTRGQVSYLVECIIETNQVSVRKNLGGERFVGYGASGSECNTLQ